MSAGDIVESGWYFRRAKLGKLVGRLLKVRGKNGRECICAYASIESDLMARSTVSARLRVPGQQHFDSLRVHCRVSRVSPVFSPLQLGLLYPSTLLAILAIHQSAVHAVFPALYTSVRYYVGTINARRVLTLL